MKRIHLTLFLLVFSAFLYSASISGTKPVQLFDSLGELGKIDFSKPLSDYQRQWVDKTDISLLTVGPGDPLYSWFGHSAFIITQPSGSKIMYDYGIFDTEQANFYLNFAMGRMYYSVYYSGADWRIEEALDEKRDVHLIDLDLKAEAKFAIIAFLQNNTKEENRTYLYHFYLDNCATRLRDILNAATSGQFESYAKAEVKGETFRTLSERYLARNPALFWVLDFLQGPSVDKPISLYEEMFLPDQLFSAVSQFAYPDGTSLARTTTVLQDTSDWKVRPLTKTKDIDISWYFLLAGLAIAFLLLLLKRFLPAIHRLFFGTLLLGLGLLGTLLTFMMFFSDMDMTYFNQNLLFVNPLLILVALRIYIVGRKRSGLTLSFFSLIMIALLVLKLVAPSVFIQDSFNTIALLLPLYLSNAAFNIPKKKP